MMKTHLLKTFLNLSLAVVCFGSRHAFAQVSEDQNLDLIEAEFNKKPLTPAKAPEVSSKDVIQSSGVPAKAGDKPEGNSDAAEGAKPEKLEKLSDLSKLQPFNDVSILQKRYMPKSNRLQIFGGLAVNTNDPWNSSYGENLRLGYNLTEAWGVEVTTYFMNTSPSVASNDLNSQNNVNAQSFGTVTGYTGAALIWAPIYAKMSYGTKKIIAFDMYFSAGGGSTSLTGTTASSASAVAFGSGQIFSINRSVGFRWDLTYTSFQVPNGSANNLLMTLGLNLYVPEARYR
jgi:outer membrane beta-barrel protein